jgi:Arc/MetJ-type ribon-helix-helix transcriptional regulator
MKRQEFRIEERYEKMAKSLVDDDEYNSKAELYRMAVKRYLTDEGTVQRENTRLDSY